MPITVWVKVSPRIADQEGEAAGTKEIVRVVLQYKILPSGQWVTVKDYNNPDWDMDFTGAGTAVRHGVHKHQCPGWSGY